MTHLDQAREMLEVAASFIPTYTEIATWDGDGCVLNVGNFARIDCPYAGGRPFTVSLEPMPGYSWPFYSLESASHAAQLFEATFGTIREASKISMAEVAA